MSTKTISGSYPTGYDLKAAYQTLDVAVSARVGGSGITTPTTVGATINNLGKVTGSGHGITLSDGGAITNGGPKNTKASIGGVDPIVADKAATVTNYGYITSTEVTTVGAGGYKYYSNDASIDLRAGGTIINKTSGSIANGIAVSGGDATIVNEGSIGAPQNSYYTPALDFRKVEKNGYSVTLSDGGSILNGAQSNDKANISAGIDVGGGAGHITNFGMIGSEDSPIYPIGLFGSFDLGNSVVLERGGSVTNGSTTDVKAVITGYSNGVVISGGAGTVTNFAHLYATYQPAHYYVTVHAVALYDGGAVVNGSAKDSAAIINGIDDGVSISGGSGTVTNYGTIEGATAVSFSSSKDKLIEEGSGVLKGKVVGGGGALELADGAGAGVLTGLGGAITDFRVVDVDHGATWTLKGASSIGALAELTNSGTLDLDGALTIEAKAGPTALDNAKGASFKISGAVGIDGNGVSRFVNAGLIEKLDSGDSTLGMAMINSGTIEAEGGSLDLKDAITGSGKLEVLTSATLEFDGSVAKTQTVIFEGTKDVLKLTDAEKFAAALSRFGGSDKLDLTQFHAITSLNYVENGAHDGGVLKIVDGGLTASIAFIGDYAKAGFATVSDGHLGTYLTYEPPA